MKLIIIFGAGAVGKMTTGQELSKITGLRLYHNHLDVELILEVFGSRTSGVGSRIRQIIFEEFVKTDNYGLIFTYMWALDYDSDWKHLDSLVDIFRKENAEIYCVELVAEQEVRLARNTTENRHKHKASKRDIAAAKERLLYEDTNYRLVSRDGEIPFENYIKIDNTHLEASDVAQIIKEKFEL